MTTKKRTKKIEPDHMELQNNFITMTSHQLRTPLSGMKWLLELLQKGSTGKLNTKQKLFLEKIYNSNEQMIAMVNDLLEVSRLEAGQSELYFQPTDVTSIVRIILKEKEQEIKKKNLQVTLTVAQEPFPLVNSEPMKIKQALGNLITNSIAFTPDRGRIIIEFRTEGSEVLGQITDDGPGILPAEQPRIFQKFFRGSNVVGLESNGTGLGLYIAKAFITTSGGKLWFKSPGVPTQIGPIKGKPPGTTFFFTLPRAD